MLFMAFLAFGRTECGLAVMTFSAEFALVNVIHLYARSALFEFKDSGMAVVAFEHRCVELMAEDRRTHLSGRIRELFFECGHFMTLYAVCRGKGLLPVMAIPTGIALIHQIHGYSGSTLFHIEKFRVTFAAGRSPGMALV